jgi:hypothetical protein
VRQIEVRAFEKLQRASKALEAEQAANAAARGLPAPSPAGGDASRPPQAS